MRYIDADALGIGKADRNAFTIPEYADGWNSAIEVIEKAPTADVVEVVRCKECIFARLEDGKIKCHHTYGLLVSKETDYCSYGERREVECEP